METIKRETGSFYIAAQNKYIKSNYIEAKIDNEQRNNNWKLWGNKDEMINHIESKWGKLVQKEYKTWHDWVDKLIHWKLRKKLKFNYSTKWRIHKPEFIQQNAIHKIHRYFEIQTDQQTPSRRPDVLSIKKKTCFLADICHRGKISWFPSSSIKQRKRKEKRT